MVEENLKQRKKDNLDLLENYLWETFQYDNEEVIEDLNVDLIVLMSDDPEFKRSLEKTLYNNQQKITSKKMQLQDKNVEPTVENWLKHFIRKQGTEKFDNVMLSKFLAESKNVKKLNNEEKQLVRKLFNLYGNLKFFPDSIRKNDPDNVEIFPLKQNWKQQKTNDQNRIKEKESDPSIGKSQQTGVNKIEELQKYKEKCPEGSLERKAIEVEIEKLSKG